MGFSQRGHLLSTTLSLPLTRRKAISKASSQSLPLPRVAFLAGLLTYFPAQKPEITPDAKGQLRRSRASRRRRRRSFCCQAPPEVRLRLRTNLGRPVKKVCDQDRQKCDPGERHGGPTLEGHLRRWRFIAAIRGGFVREDRIILRD